MVFLTTLLAEAIDNLSVGLADVAGWCLAWRWLSIGNNCLDVIAALSIGFGIVVVAVLAVGPIVFWAVVFRALVFGAVVFVVPALWRVRFGSCDFGLMASVLNASVLNACVHNAFVLNDLVLIAFRRMAARLIAPGLSDVPAVVQRRLAAGLRGFGRLAWARVGWAAGLAGLLLVITPAHPPGAMAAPFSQVTTGWPALAQANGPQAPAPQAGAPGGSGSPSPLPDPPPRAASPVPAWVTLEGRRVIEIRSAAGAQAPEGVARRASEDLRTLAESRVAPEQLQVREVPPYSMIGLVGDDGRFSPRLAIDDRAGAAFGISRAELADQYRDQLRGAIRQFRSSHTPLRWLRGTALALLVLAIYLLWIRGQNWLNRLLALRIEQRARLGGPGLRLGGAQVLDLEQVREALQLLRRLGHWSLLLLISYLLLSLIHI